MIQSVKALADMVTEECDWTLPVTLTLMYWFALNQADIDGNVDKSHFDKILALIWNNHIIVIYGVAKKWGKYIL